MRDDVSALYIDPRGPYPKLLADCWDETRDARLYAGPNPVVAHPPCGAWGSMAHLYRREDGDCAPIAIGHVRAFGGVLEHPAGSRLFRASKAPFPGELPDEYDGRTWALEQVSWGHVCRKPTWIYTVGVDPMATSSTLRFGGEPTHQIWGSKSSPRHRPLKGTHAALRRRTPVAFAEWLIELAAQAKVSPDQPIDRSGLEPLGSALPHAEIQHSRDSAGHQQTRAETTQRPFGGAAEEPGGPGELCIRRVAADQRAAEK